MMRRYGVCLLAGLLAACGAGDKAGAPAGGSAAGPASGAAAPPPFEVDVLTLAADAATLTQDLPGRLRAQRTAEVRARVEGIVEQRLFAEGSDIRAGTPLFRIDARTYRTALAAAEAERAAAQAAQERTEKLVNIQFQSRQTLDAAIARLRQAEASVAKARLDLENAQPVAPIAGRVGRALVTEGALVGKGEATHLATIEQIDPIRVEFTQPYADLRRLQEAVKAGQQRKAETTAVRLVFDDGSLYPETGRLNFADQAVDPASGAIVLRAEFPNPHRELLPGAFVRVRFPQAQVASALRVPQRAVQTGAQGQSVFVVDADNKVVAKPIRIGAMAGGDFIVAAGLAAGDRVVVNGVQKVRPGAVVRPVPWPPAGTVPPAPTSAAVPARP